MVEHPAVNRRVAGSSPARGVMVAMRHWVTPVPIPNTMVKTMTADGTWWVTAWESRWPPLLFALKPDLDRSGFFNFLICRTSFCF